jgi:hypothetical protein
VRKLLNGEEVPENDNPIDLVIHTKAPGKWKLIDMETGEEIKLHPNEIKESYLSQMAEYKKELMLKCGQYKIDFVEADINEGFDQVLMPYLMKRTRMI